MKITLVVATKETEQNFFKNTATGRSLSFNRPSYLEVKLFSNNSRGLPSIYNQVINESKNNPSTLVFAHDDLHFLDYYWCDRLKEGLLKFNIIGIVGNKRRVPKQPSWALIDTKGTWDSKKNFSGVIAHGNEFPPKKINVFGMPRQQVKLIDGLLIATESETLLKNNLLFDERFSFHFYDLDFSRQAEQKNITCGTWDLSLIHESGGSFFTEDWKNSYNLYLEKWNE
jgi:hypothetical protein